MWMLSLLMNRKNMRDLESAIKLIIIVTSSKCLTDRVRLCIGTLSKVLKDFRADIFEETKKAIENESSELTTDRQQAQIQRKITISNVNNHHSKYILRKYTKAS